MNKTIRKFKCNGEYELEQGYASYRTIVDEVCGNIILCNNITSIDECLYDNIVSGSFTYCSINEDDYNNDKELQENYGTYEELVESEDYIEYEDIYQYFLTSMNESDVDYLNKYYPDELIITYSDVLDLYVLCVPHWGTNWSYVLTDVKIVE